MMMQALSNIVFSLGLLMLIPLLCLIFAGSTWLLMWIVQDLRKKPFQGELSDTIRNAEPIETPFMRAAFSERGLEIREKKDK